MMKNNGLVKTFLQLVLRDDMWLKNLKKKHFSSMLRAVKHKQQNKAFVWSLKKFKKIENNRHIQLISKIFFIFFLIYILKIIVYMGHEKYYLYIQIKRQSNKDD